MKKIREALLNQHIGAITIGFVLALAISNFVNALVQSGLTYWNVREQAKTDFRMTAYFPWTVLIVAFVSMALYVLVAFILMRWLYFSKNLDIPESPTEAKETI